MAESEVLSVEVRNELGRRKVRRLRAEGKVPAVVYGHGEDTVSLTLPADEITRIVSHGHRIVDLQGGVTGSAYVREVQWDTYGDRILHVDLTRVDAGELIETTVTLEVRGEAPGTKMGGVVVQPLHTLSIKCPPRSMTDKLLISVNELQLDESITVGQIELPEGAETSVDPETIIIQCVEKQAEEEEEATPTVGAAEPEVIGKKDDDQDGGDS